MKKILCLSLALWLLPVLSASAEDPVFRTTLVAENLTAPIDIVTLPDGSGRKVILDQVGVIHLMSKDGSVAVEPFLDVRDRLLPLEEGFEERGLLGMAVHPEFEVTGRVFITYSAPLAGDAPGGWNYTRRVSEFTVSKDNPDRLDHDSERLVLSLHWPSRKHNGGALAFGPDGYLYIGFGDGGGIHGVGPKVLYDAFSVPPVNQHWDTFAQDPHSLYGKILRIDVDRGYPGYAIPEDNPFQNGRGRGEIYAWGFRNPYRMSFDPEDDGSFVIAAVAETLWESIYVVDAPGNYGWPLKEATHCFDRNTPLEPPETCSTDTANDEYPIKDPVVEYPNMSVHRDGSTVSTPGVGTAVVGSVMNRSDEFPGLSGRLFFADWSLDFQKPSGQLFVAEPSPDNSGLWPYRKIAQFETRIVALVRDVDDAVFILTNDNFGPYGNTGKVFRLELTPN